jgi:LruC domain-containing protein
MVISESYISLMSNGLETGQLKPSIIVFDNAHSILQGHGGTTGVNVEEGSGFIIPDTVNIHISYPLNSYTLSQLNLQSINPFMIVNRERGKEVIHTFFFPRKSRKSTKICFTLLCIRYSHHLLLQFIGNEMANDSSNPALRPALRAPPFTIE